jgi:hypothetical protein
MHYIAPALDTVLYYMVHFVRVWQERNRD